MLSHIEARTGTLLISEPFMLDPAFKRSVVLLAEHTEDETIGYVLNQQSNLLLKDVFPDMPKGEFPVYIGGPVANDTLHFVHRCYDKFLSGIEIAEGIFWSGDFDTLRTLVNDKKLKADEIKFFLGYSGWSKGQLADELQQNTWIVSDHYHANVVFSSNEENIWREAVIDLGPKYAHIVNFPENPMWN